MKSLKEYKKDRKDLDIRDYVEYDETSSTCLRWKRSVSSRGLEGEECFGSLEEVGRETTGYFRGFFNYKGYYGHQVVWYLHHGVWSDRKMVINHIDGYGLNNKIENLELISFSDNVSHRNKIVNIRNISGVRGLRQKPDGRWVVIHKMIYRGTKDTLEEGIELWNKCYELDRQGITYQEKIGKKVGISGVLGVKPCSNGKYSVVYKEIYRGRVNTIEEGIELRNKCIELDEQGIVYRNSMNKNLKKT